MLYLVYGVNGGENIKICKTIVNNRCYNEISKLFTKKARCFMYIYVNNCMFKLCYSVFSITLFNDSGYFVSYFKIVYFINRRHHKIE